MSVHKQRLKVFLAMTSAVSWLLWGIMAAAQTPPSLTPTVPLPNNPIVQVIPGPIPIQTICTEQYDPVCAQIGGVESTYSNRCFAEAAGAEVVAEGSCTSNVISPLPN